MQMPMIATPLFAMGWTEWLIIGAVVALLFGAKKLPQLGKGLGEGIRNFTKGIKGDAAENDQLAKNDDSESNNGKDDSKKA